LTDMKLDISAELQTLGLTQSEAKVYLASLKLGPATAQLLAAKSGTSRPTAYIMIESLAKRGLMSSYFKGKKKYFAAADPHQLTYIVQHLKREALEKEAAVGKIIEELGKIVEAEKNVTEVRVLEGSEVTVDIQRDIMESGAEEAFELINRDEVRKWIPPMRTGDIREKIALKLKTYSMFTSVHGKGIDFVRPAGSKSESRYLDGKKYPVHGEVLVYGDRICIESLVPKKTAIIIRDKGLAETIKTMFKALWDKAEKE
jgi:HTH-type transcriptional regulator, sugar sensing transcriptional regulator